MNQKKRRERITDAERKEAYKEASKEEVHTFIIWRLKNFKYGIFGFLRNCWSFGNRRYYMVRIPRL